LLFSALAYGQVVINEIDSDTPSTDKAEFIELYAEANFDLTGYVVVLFNGSDNKSYGTPIDLSGYSTDANGFFVIGSTGMGTSIEKSPSSSGWLQNGADAVAIYKASVAEFPNDTEITTTNLIDALVYDTSDPDDSVLLSGFGETMQYNENQNGEKDAQSIQLQSDGSYAAVEPTMGAVNASPSQISYNQVNDLSGLRSGTEGDYYEVSGEVIVSYARNSRNQKYIQDNSGAVLIDDTAGKITSSYNVGDGMTSLKGKLSSYSGVLQFIPQEDPGQPTSTGNTTQPLEVTIAEINQDIESYESEVITLKDVSITEADGTAVFASSNNYTLNQADNSLTLRTGFSEADYIGQIIPSGENTFNAIVGEFNGAAQIIPLPGQEILDINKINFKAITMYPNPAVDMLYFIGLKANTNVSIFNVVGKLELEDTFIETLDITDLKPGLYFVKLENENKVFTLLKK
jgi:hypothetical protein